MYIKATIIETTGHLSRESLIIIIVSGRSNGFL